MTSHRATLIEAAAADSGLPPDFARHLIESTPWLDGTEELSEELGPELLSEETSIFNLGQTKVAEFIDRYNALVQSAANPQALRRTEAYATIAEVLAAYGTDDAFGDGDYWLVADSFSTSAPVVMVYDRFRLPADALAKLQELLNQFSGVFSELRVNTEFGSEIATLRPR
jgi:hypothetical protein